VDHHVKTRCFRGIVCVHVLRWDRCAGGDTEVTGPGPFNSKKYKRLHADLGGPTRGRKKNHVVYAIRGDRGSRVSWSILRMVEEGKKNEWMRKRGWCSHERPARSKKGASGGIHPRKKKDKGKLEWVFVREDLNLSGIGNCKLKMGSRTSIRTTGEGTRQNLLE